MYLRGYTAMVEALTNSRYLVANSIRGFRMTPPVNDFQRGMADALLDSVGC